MARQALRNHLENREAIIADTRQDPELAEKRGCFVTLRKCGALRGCIGTFEADKPLFQNVMEIAVSAGFRDPRFPPLSREELDIVRIEISVLGDLRKMNSPEELEIGRHGVYVRHGATSGTFLPEVAVEQGWSREEFIRCCAEEKARIPAAELSRAEIFLYEVEKSAEGKD